MSHHRPHLHDPCAVDIVAKYSAVGGALCIVKKERKHRMGGKGPADAAKLAVDTDYEDITPFCGEASAGGESEDEDESDSDSADGST